jgi:hypothetical protein
MNLLLSAILGMAAHAALTVGWHYLFFRDFLEDGPYPFVVAVTSLFGAFLGPATFTAWRYSEVRPLLASLNCFLAAVVVFGALVGAAYWGATRPDSDAPFWTLLGIMTIVFLPTVAWGALSFRWGVRLLWKAATGN